MSCPCCMSSGQGGADYSKPIEPRRILTWDQIEREIQLRIAQDKEDILINEKIERDQEYILADSSDSPRNRFMRASQPKETP